MFFDTMLLYALASGLVWAACIVWMFLSIWHYNVYSFFIAFAILMLAPVFFELILNIYGFLTSSSLLFIKHQEVCDKKYKDRFPIIYSFDYGSSLMWMERMHGLDSWLNFYIYRQIEEQEIVDSKIEEQEYNENKKKYEDAQRSRGGNRGTGDGRPSEYEDDEYQRRSRRLGGGNTLGKDRSKFDPNFVPDDVKFDPYEIKNFYHEPDSPSRAFLLDFMSIFYLFKLCYSFMLTAYLDVPALIFPAWIVRWQTLRPLAKAAQGTVDGVCLALKNGWAINLSGGFTHCTKDFGDMFNIYPDISLAIHYAKKWHPLETRRILLIDTSATQANGVARDFYGDESVYILDFYNPLIAPKDHEARKGIHAEVSIGEFDNDESYLSKIQHNVSVAISTFNPELIIYNAGYDVMFGDRKGNLKMSEESIIMRDELVFRAAKDVQDIPILMTIGGCYKRGVEHVISRSIRNVIVKFELSQKILDIAVGTQNIKLGYKLAKSGAGGYRGRTGDIDFRTRTMDRGSYQNNGMSDTGTISVGDRRGGLGAGNPYAQRKTRDSMYDVNLSPNDKKQQNEIDRLSQALFDRGEVGIKDRWMGRRK